MNRKIYPRELAQEKMVIKMLYNKILAILIICEQTGEPVILTPAEEQEAQRTIREYGFNMVVSDKISMDRRIKDTRPSE